MPPSDEPASTTKPKESVIDHAAGLLVEHCTSADEPSFAMRFIKSEMGDGGAREVRLSVVPELPAISAILAPSERRAHLFGSVDALCQYVNREGDQSKGIFFVGTEAATYLFDDAPVAGGRESVRASLARSADFKAWDELIDVEMAHRPLVKALSALTHNFVDPTVIDLLREASWSVSINVDSGLQSTDKSLTYSYAAKGGEKTAKIPRAIAIKVPILDEDVGDEAAWVEMTLGVVIEMPNDPKDQAKFTLLCPKWEAHQRARLTGVEDEIRGAMPGYLVVSGQHCWLAPQERKDYR